MNVSDFLRQRNVDFSSIKRRAARCALEAANALKAQGRGMVKSVLLRADHGYCYMLAVLPSEKRIDLGRLSTALGGSRLELATKQELRQHFPNGEGGALSPFGSKYGVHTVVDESLAGKVEIVFDDSTPGKSVKMGFDDYRRTEQPLMLSFAHEQSAA
ncbi:MAG: YbaK/EbsC family protein [Pirellulaceae bacterium]